MEHYLLSVHVKDDEGQLKPLVGSTRVHLTGSPQTPEKIWFTPFIGSIFLLLGVILLTFIEFGKHTYFRWIDYVVFGISGLAGMLMLSIITVYVTWYTIPNWWIFWLHPFHLVGVVFFSSARFLKPAYYYHIGNILLISFLIAGRFFLTQHYNEAFIPLMACLWIRSVAGIIRYRKNFIHNPGIEL